MHIVIRLLLKQIAYVDNAIIQVVFIFKLQGIAFKYHPVIFPLWVAGIIHGCSIAHISIIIDVINAAGIDAILSGDGTCNIYSALAANTADKHACLQQSALARSCLYTPSGGRFSLTAQANAALFCLKHGILANVDRSVIDIRSPQKAYMERRACGRCALLSCLFFCVLSLNIGCVSS